MAQHSIKDLHVVLWCASFKNSHFIQNMHPLAETGLRSSVWSLRISQITLIDSLTACFSSRISLCYQGHLMLTRVFIGSVFSQCVCAWMCARSRYFRGEERKSPGGSSSTHFSSSVLYILQVHLKSSESWRFLSLYLAFLPASIFT